MNNPRNLNISTPLLDVHHSKENPTLSGDSNHSKEDPIDDALNLNVGNLES